LTFKAFSDNVSAKFKINDLCGPITYEIVDPKPFLKLVSPISDPPTEGQLQVTTKLVSDKGKHKVTIQGKLDLFPESTPAKVDINVEIVSTAANKFTVLPPQPKKAEEPEAVEAPPEEPVPEEPAKNETQAETE